MEKRGVIFEMIHRSRVEQWGGKGGKNREGEDSIVHDEREKA